MKEHHVRRHAVALCGIVRAAQAFENTHALGVEFEGDEQRFVAIHSAFMPERVRTIVSAAAVRTSLARRGLRAASVKIGPVVIVRPILCKPFVGRREELSYLRERRLEAGASHGGLVLVAGEAGVGKSRLIGEFCNALANTRWRIGIGACHEFASRPYWPILEALLRLDSEPFELGAAGSKAEHFEAIAARIAEIQARKSVAIVIEDVHWADAATLELLAFLGPKLAKMRVLVITTFRTDDLPRNHPGVAIMENVVRASRAGRVNLAPLRGTELRTFIDEALADIALPEQTRRAIAVASDGNPFFTEELLKSAVESHSAPNRVDGRGKLPQTVRATLLGRLDPFEDRERRIIMQAAVIGRTFSLALLAETLAANDYELLPTLRRARDLQLIEEISPSTFRFRHGLTREALYGDFLGAEVRPRHRAIAQALEKTSPGKLSLEALAYHWWAAEDHARSARYNEQAGDAAAAVFAHEDALAFYERALGANGLGPLVRGTLLEKIGETYLALAQTSDAHGAFERAAVEFRDADEFEREAKARVVGAQTAYLLDISDPTADLRTMLARLEPSQYAAVSRVCLGLAWITASEWYPDQAASYLQRVDARALDDPELRLPFHNVAAWIAMTVGDIETFRREHALWVRAASAVGSPRALAGAYYNGAMCLAFFGIHDEALALIERAFEVTREARFRQGELSTHQIAAMIHLFRGDLPRARQECLAVPTSTENKVTSSLASAYGLLVAIALDDRDLIATYFDGHEAEQLASPDYDCAAAFAELFVRRGRPRDARTLLDRAGVEGDVVRGSFYTMLAAGKYGSPVARERARESLVRASIGETPSPERFALSLFDARIAAEAGRMQDARAHARIAADGFREIRFPLLEAEALEIAGDVDDARAIYARCGAAYALRQLGEVPSAAVAAAAPLSARELEIAKLAVSGRSNLQIAQQLSITHKTVEKHLGSAYHKLGVTSRFELRSLIAPVD